MMFVHNNERIVKRIPKNNKKVSKQKKKQVKKRDDLPEKYTPEGRCEKYHTFYNFTTLNCTIIQK